MTTIPRTDYAAMHGPTTDDKVRLADTELVIEVERDLTTYRGARRVVEFNGAVSGGGMRAFSKFACVLAASFVLLSVVPAQSNGEYREMNEALDRQFKLIETCMDDATSEATAKACIRAAYPDCMTEGTNSRSDESTCLNRAAGALSTLYRRQVVKGLSDMLPMVETLVRLDSTYSQDLFETALKAEQSWNDYRVAQCEHEMNGYGAGNAVATAEPVCHAEFYALRIFRFSGR